MTHRKYNQRLEIRLTSDEKQLACQLATETGLSLSSYLRRCILQKHLPRKITAVSVQTYQELGKIAVTLHQLAIALNNPVSQSASLTTEYLSLLKKIEPLLHQVRLEIASGKLKIGSIKDDCEAN
jgi:uncharacterized protein (DUF1778 family)